MGVYQDIDIGKQHPQSPTAGPETGFVISDVERSGPIQIDFRERVDSPHGDQLEGRLL